MIKNILIADDHTLFTNGLKLLLSTHKRYRVLATATNGEEVKTVLQEQTIDILLLDINMPLLNGYQTTVWVRSHFPQVKIIILSMLADEHSVVKLLEVGAHGYLFKNTDEEELFIALETVLKQERYIASALSHRVNEIMALHQSRQEKPAKLIKLSSREKDIVQLIIEGNTNAEIAERLFLSVRTVDTHRKNILAKLHLKNTASLVKYAVENKVFMGL